ncbi:2'-5' RNA ligase family protein [Actinoplanes missouriensis]|uniref:2'-5' RNA ligase family protein n=1 Tax=Actinoplanes missouriensis TaxID=1866 RepID=UPI0034035D8E
MQTVELLLDPELDRAVRSLWDELHAAGLRSLATHTHPTNRPHVTLATADAVDGAPELGLPVPVRMGPALVLGRALVLAVESAELRAMQARVWAALDEPAPMYAPPNWFPHVSLALRMPADQHERALALLAGRPRLGGACVTARSYDSESRRVRLLGGDALV